MKTFLKTFIALLSVATTAAASSIVTVSSHDGGRYLMDASGERLANGSLVWLGSFDTPGNISALPINSLETEANWSFYGQTTVISIFGEQGKISADVNSADSTNAFTGKQIFLWIFNGPTLNASTQYAIFTVAANGNWVFPQGSPAGHTTISLNDNLYAVNGVGSINFDEMRLTAIPVPEPATYALLGGLLSVAVVAVRQKITHNRRGRTSA